jgi:hypothetical protein
MITTGPRLRPGVEFRTRGGVLIALSSTVLSQAIMLGVIAAAIGSLRRPYGLGHAAVVAAMTMSILILSTAAHEAAHLGAARARGLRIVAVRAHGILSAGVEREATHNRGTEVAVCLAGPVATLVLLIAGILMAGLGQPSTAADVGKALFVVNALAMVASLPPVPGCDAMRAWRALRDPPQ